MEVVMKYVVAWESRQNISEELIARGLQVFSKWTPSPNVTYREFLGRIDNSGGFAVVETDDPRGLARDASVFEPYFYVQIHPVLEVTESAEVGGEAVQFRSSIG
jgi:hypothetical protein